MSSTICLDGIWMFRATFQGQRWDHEVASTAKWQMSALGHKATWRESAMSFIPPKADIRQREWYVRLVRLKRGNADDVEEMHGPASRRPLSTMVLGGL
jgi:hypothetical protein